MDIKKMIEKYNMKPHEENGAYAECHYPHEGTERAASGSSCFYTGPGEKTLFHRIDCDEYWCFHAGSDLEVWMIDPDGTLTIKTFGLGKDADPVIYFPKGMIFGSRNLDLQGEGTFFSCITVPRFDYQGFEILEEEEVLKICPSANVFF